MVNKILSIMLVLFASTAFANEAAKEEKKPAPPTSEQELNELQGKVQTLKGKIENREKEIKKLSEEQDHAPEEKKIEISKQLTIEHKELQRETKEYNEALYRLKYQFPERGSSHISEEKMKEIKTLRELEEQHSLDGRIKKNMNTIREHYKRKDAEKAVKSEEVKKPAEAPVDPLLQPVIIRK